MDSLVIYGIPAAGVIIALVEMSKRSFGLPNRWAAPLAAALGIVLATLAKLSQPDLGPWLQVELLGLLSGLSASGLYSGGRTVARK
ncbi:MAG: hypothetical protein DRO14_00550 [Thermoprotei archaeon]|nr:MAG: hypothetical protein DRO14_00550 [Thermoprotei archaeon]